MGDWVREGEEDEGLGAEGEVVEVGAVVAEGEAALAAFLV